MDIKIIKELTRLMRDNDLVEIEVESADLKVKLKKAGPEMVPMAMPSAMAHHPMALAAPAATPAPVADEFANCRQITSPTPGTVYLKPNPDAAAFIQVGAQVDENKVVCLVEAMKVFNEIKPEAGMRGSIRKICVEEGQAVEFGTVLFLVG